MISPIFLSFFVACAPKVEVVVAPPPPVAKVEQVQAAISPSSYHNGQQAGPALRRSPVEAWSIQLDGPITVPIFSDGKRFFAVGGGSVYAIQDGKLLWKQKNGARAAVLVEEGLAVTVPDRVLILDPETGEQKQEQSTPGIVGAVEQLGPHLIWVSEQGAVHTGKETVELGQTPAGHIAAEGSIAYLATVQGELFAISGGAIAWNALLPGAACGGPTIGPEAIYVPLASSATGGGGVVAFGKDGTELWRFKTDYQPGGSLSVGELLWIPDRDGVLYALQPRTGKKEWTSEGFGEYRTQGMWVDRSLYAGNADGRLYRVDLDDGGTAWSVNLGSAVTGDPTLSGGLLVVGTAAGRLVGLAEGY